MSNIIINEYGNPSLNINKLLFKNTNSLVGDTKTKITYDDSGLVTNGEDITTADVDESANRYYLTDELLDKINSSANNNNDNFYYLTTRTITNNLIVEHNLNGKVLVEARDENDDIVIITSKRVDDNSVIILLEEDFVGYLYIYKVSTGFFKYNITLLNNNTIINHNLDGIVIAKLFNSDDIEVDFSYKMTDSDNIIIYLEEPIEGYIYIFKIN